MFNKATKYKTGFIDRFLVSCEAYQVTPVLFFNKLDLANDSDLNELNILRLCTKDLGYHVLHGSINHQKVLMR